MSLIEEALRRLNDPLLKDAGTPPPITRERPAEERPAAHSWPVTSQPPSSLTANPLSLVALSIAVLTTALLIGGAFWLGHTLPGTAAAPEVPPAQETAPLQEPEPQLTGIVVGAGAPYAVIDGTIAGLGERVGAFTLQEIVEGAVTLRRDDGTELVLRVKR